ncbi:MAG: inositol monophosphatase family protein [Pirellulales bacterium]|jgi:myo-inositol-1(or 4)-monophosphatase|nr:inositol monophosphatase family protein [Thermoguttaceae bacterium]MDD4787143.1 inositol monophosphatase family protein [Pirellulales bacterium]NLZ00951.1 inositol monophosphatase [Pirellulaceae bacterium]
MEDFLTICEQAVRGAGAVLTGLFGRATVREKGPRDLVTEADLASQELVRQTVARAFPDHDFIGEEGQPATDGRPAGAEYRWIVDPLDGTTNFAHGVPHFCVSLALENRGTLLVGAVFDPLRDECYTAKAGAGSWLNGEPIRTSGVADLSQSLAGFGLPNVVTPDDPDLRLFRQALGACQAIRRTGSAALNHCYVAAGRFDVAWNYGTRIWDVAAAALIVKEAGGVIDSPDGGGFLVERGRLFSAANRSLMEQLRQLAARRGG